MRYKTTYRSINTSYVNKSFSVAGYQIGAVRLYAFVLSLALLGMLYLLLHRTRFGLAVRATVQNPQSAQLLGVDSARVSALGFGLGAATAAAAGAIFGMLYPFNSGSHYDLISRLLSVVVLGGLGSIAGAAVGRCHHRRRELRRRGGVVAVVVGDDVLRRAVARLADPPARAVRQGCPRRVVTRC